MSLPAFIISSAIVLALGLGVNNINTDQARGAVDEKEREVSMAMLRQGLSSYYAAHEGKYPASIDGDVLQIMGLEGLDLDGFQYVRTAEDAYTLQYVPGSGNITGYTGGR